MSSVRVQFLGTGGPFASGGRLQTCILIDSDAGRCLIDCGTSALVAMARYDVDPDSIDAILLTHLHGDHFGAIPFLIVEAQAGIRDRSPRPRQTPLRIAGPAETEDRVRRATEAFGYAEDYARARASGLLEFITLEQGEPTAIGPFVVTARGVVHTPEATALRVECAGKTVAYAGDTRWTDTLLEVAAGADLFICPAYSFVSSLTSLVSYEEVIAHRERLTCKRLMLTHIGPDMQRRLADVTVEVAEDGMAVALED